MDTIDMVLLEPTLKKYLSMGRTALLPALQDAQGIYGYIPEPVAIQIAMALKVPLSEVHGVLEFYTLLYNEPVANTLVHICGDPACAMAGADSLFKVIHREYELRLVDDRITKTVTIERAPCLGLCELAPAVLIQGKPVKPDATQTWEELVSGKPGRLQPLIGGDISILTANFQNKETAWLKKYENAGGYTGLRKALGLSPQAVIDEIKAAGLVGRGGAAFPTGIKWESTARSLATPKYVVCNADEAEPGTFKDRIMMEKMPHRILEGIIIAAYAIGASKGYIYIRGEYLNPFQLMTKAVEEAMKGGYIGNNILGSGFNFELEIRRGAGAYICGEETALFESIEGKRGFPRVKPPFPTTSGLFGKPTVINNVETLANVPIILSGGVENYRKIGTEKSPGPKLFCLSGDVVQPGLYEVPFGVTFRHLLFDLAGGVRQNRRLQAALFGGAAGAFATEKDLEVKLSFEDLRTAGLPLGSGVITVFDETRDIRDISLRLAHFFAEESCGKCYPCQIGTQRQYEIMHRITNDMTISGDMERLLDIGKTMTDASLCGLGQTAASAILSAIRTWPEKFQTETMTSFQNSSES